ncbi:Protein CBG26460 [Caenorhabditis briggsae]|uniref:Protein CBG26460 n=1 Tax=Caenorhabditis briggsae TaxID=6238 RepID=B6IKP7_CAEBR|nr:Protein CBG26460 [Caenorhabditis briggsae]CAS00477.1 Protein CBG26460 [Caenorhabditis briggsae]
MKIFFSGVVFRYINERDKRIAIKNEREGQLKTDFGLLPEQ